MTKNLPGFNSITTICLKVSEQETSYLEFGFGSGIAIY